MKCDPMYQKVSRTRIQVLGPRFYRGIPVLHRLSLSQAPVFSSNKNNGNLTWNFVWPVLSPGYISNSSLGNSRSMNLCVCVLFSNMCRAYSNIVFNYRRSEVRLQSPENCFPSPAPLNLPFPAKLPPWFIFQP